MLRTTVRPSGLRRYPALAFLLAAAVLSTLLPSSLRLPLSGPAASAELAPVPGKSDNAVGDLSSLNSATSGGLGAGAGEGGGSSGGPDEGGFGSDDRNRGNNPTNKKCVRVDGSLHQTEDPLSPTCVPFFAGDNGGATYPGVTAEEITIVRMTCQGDGHTLLDVEDESTWQGEDLQALAALSRYYNSRFQTYGRRVHLYSMPGPSGTCNTLAQDRALIQTLVERRRPFMILDPWGGGQSGEAYRRGIMIGVSRPVRKSDTQIAAPYLIAYPPTVEDTMLSAAGAVCNRLAGRLARYAPDPSMHSRTRKFGIYYSRGNDPDSYGANVLLDEIRKQCGDKAGVVVEGYIQRPNQPETDTSAEQGIAKLQLAGVTTILADSSIMAYVHADSQRYYPEWLVLNSSPGDNTVTAAVPATVTNRGYMGLMFWRRYDAPRTQYHNMAAAEGGCQGSTCSGRRLIDPYNLLQLVFGGIQAAGPKLTPAAFDRGLRSLPARQSDNPYSPSAYFAPNDYTFLKDLAFVRWDPTGKPPGSQTVGCWKLVEDGRRYRVEDWPSHPGDDDLEAPQPCQGTI